MNKIKAAIIEDEIPAGRLLHKMLSGLRPDWEIVVQRIGNIHTQFLDSFLLERDQFRFHLPFLPALIRKLSR